MYELIERSKHYYIIATLMDIVLVICEQLYIDLIVLSSIVPHKLIIFISFVVLHKF